MTSSVEKIDQQVLHEYIEFCNKKWGISVFEKKRSILMKILGVLLFFNKKFMTKYKTTIGKTVYWPNLEEIDKNPYSSFQTFFHEAQHGHDYIKLKILFSLSYISPQILAVFALLAFFAVPFSNEWLYSLLCIGFLAPIPSYFRALWEWRGSSCNMALEIWLTGNVSDGRIDRLVKRFKGPDYWFMWPFPKWFRKKLAKLEAEIRAGHLTDVQRETYRFLSDRGIVRHAL